MSEFKREERYIVVKLKDLEACSSLETPNEAEEALRCFLASWHAPTRACVVVESDWPEYEQVWSMIEARVTGSQSALAAKDARIAELEEHCKRLGAGGAERYWEGRWRDADAELSRLRDAATPSEDGGEVPEVVAHRPRPVLFSSDGELLMTVAQHSRIVAAKDAEIARLRELHENAHSAAKTLMAERATLMEQAAHWLEVNAPSGGCIETNIADELRAEAEQLRAQPARQAGGDERCPTCDGTGDVHGADGEWKGRCHCQPIRQVLVGSTWIDATDLLLTLLADEYPTRNVYLAPQAALAPAAPSEIEVDIEGLGCCQLQIVDGKAFMSSVTVADILRMSALTPAAVVMPEQKPVRPFDLDCFRGD